MLHYTGELTVSNKLNEKCSFRVFVRVSKLPITGQVQSGQVLKTRVQTGSSFKTCAEEEEEEECVDVSQVFYHIHQYKSQ